MPITNPRPLRDDEPQEPPADPVRVLQQRARILARLTDGRGRIERWPKRRVERLLVLEHLAAHFEPGEVLTERQVNDRLDALHAFHDPVFLRRYLIDEGFLARRRDGSAYWRTTEA